MESYYKRFWKRFLTDATPWARDNVLWGTLVLVLPPLAIYLRDRHAQIDWELIRSTLWLYGIALFVYALVHVCRTPRKLDRERDASERSLRARITDLEETVRKRDDAIRALNEKPKRNPAQQHHYDTAKKVLAKLGPDAVVALRHLKTNGKIKFGFYNPRPLPPGIPADRLEGIYLGCVAEGLVALIEGKLGSGERTYEIAPTMNAALDDLLYES